MKRKWNVEARSNDDVTYIIVCAQFFNSLKAHAYAAEMNETDDNFTYYVVEVC